MAYYRQLRSDSQTLCYTLTVNIDKVLVIASAFIKNSKGQVLLLERSNKSSYPGYWQLVEGKLERGELPVVAIKREIEEETGSAVSALDIDSATYNEIEAKGLKYLCFRIVFFVKINTKKIKTSDEHASFGWFSKPDALSLRLLPGTEDILKKLF